MSLKNLREFVRFDADAFFKDKVIRVTAKEVWTDFDTKKICGTKLSVSITVDNTAYHPKDGKLVTNKYAPLSVKISKPVQDVKVELDDAIRFVNVVCTIYGDYRNELSIKCEDIKVLQPNPHP